MQADGGTLNHGSRRRRHSGALPVHRRFGAQLGFPPAMRKLMRAAVAHAE